MARPRTATVFSALALGAGCLWALGAVSASRAAPAGAPFKVIVNHANANASVDRKFLADVFLKKVTRWGDGEVIHPVDLRADSPVRQEFSEEVVRRSVVAVKNYWQQLVFSGRDVPPPEVDTDEQVIRYVQRFGGAVGYVSAGANLERVKSIAVK
jgi:ABC-type phosphate transport system substrate-binding protein